MGTLHVRLLGKFSAKLDGQELTGLEAAKAQELFAFLLLSRDRPHARETLAGILWGDGPTDRARKALRQALWQVMTALSPWQVGRQLLDVTPNWLCLHGGNALALDTAEVEQAFALVQGVAGHEMAQELAERLRTAVALYGGDLLTGWYHDWCLYERERFRDMYVALLDKLMAHYEARQNVDAAIEYGSRILQVDRARERTHRRLMRLHSLAGDRTGGIRQYERCVVALREELSVAPTASTTRLYHQILNDEIAGPALDLPQPEAAGEVLGHLQHIRSVLLDLQRQILQDIRAVEMARGRPIAPG